MKRVQLEIFAGTILVLLSVVIVAVLGFQETERLTDYELQQIAGRVEFGAAVFEINCKARQSIVVQSIARGNG